MTDIYLIRHCEAEGNLYRRAQGQHNSHITPRGEKQLEQLAERFKSIHLDAVYSSDLTRARLTALAVAETQNLPVTTDSRLREINLGVWEDKPWGNILLEDAEQYSYFSRDPEKWRIDGSESFSALGNRMLEAILELAKKHDGQTIAIASHGMAIRTFLSQALGVSSAEISRIAHADNTAVSLLHIEDENIQVEFFNDNSHLTGGTSTFATQTWWKDKNAADMHNLAFYPLDMANDRQLYIDCYADAWRSIHNTLKHFTGDSYWHNAIAHCGEDKRFVVKVLAGEKLAGLTDLSLAKVNGERIGWISLCYLTEGMRGEGLGIQLVGHAVSLFREKNFKSIHLHVAEQNDRAIAFYKKCGFTQSGESRGFFGKLLELKKEI